MSKAALIVIFLLGVGLTWLLRSGNWEQTADLAAAVPTNFGKAAERDEPIFINSGAKADRLFTTLPLEITAGASEPSRIVVVDPKPMAVPAPVTSWHWHEGSKKVTRK